MKPKSKLLAFLTLAGSSLLAVSNASAATVYWDGASGNWSTLGNWSTASGATTPDPAAVPGILDDLIFNITTVDGNQTITLDADQAAKSLRFDNTGTTTLLGDGTDGSTLTLGTGGITLDALAGAVTLGDGTAANDVLISLTSGAHTWANNSTAAFTFNNSAATFSRSAGSTLAFTGTGSFAVTSGVSNTNGIVGPWAFFGSGTSTRYAYNNAGVIAGFDGGAFTTQGSWTSATTNYEVNTTTKQTLAASRSINTLRYSGTGLQISLGNNAGNRTLTLNGILAVGASGTLEILREGTTTGTVIAGGTGEIVIAGPQNVTISAPISSGAVTYSGTGTLALSGANTFSGGVTLNSGTLQVATGVLNGGLGTGTFTINPGTTLRTASAGSFTTAGDSVWNGNFTVFRGTTGTAQWTQNGNVTLGANVNINSTNNYWNTIINGNIGETGGSRSLSISGSGQVMVLNGTNSYTGGTTITAGTLVMTKPSNLGSGALNVGGNTFFYVPTSPGALNIGAWTQTGGSIGVSLGGSASQSAIVASGAATLSGTGTVNIYARTGVTPAAGTHNLVTATGGLAGGTYNLGRVYNNTDFTISGYARTATAISVDVTAATPISGAVYWKGGFTGATGVWSVSNGSSQSNWQVSDGVNQPLTPGATADLIFSTATSPGTMANMTLGSNMTIRSLTVNNTATAFSLLAGGYSANNTIVPDTLTITPSSSTTGITIGSGVQASSIAANIVLGDDQTWTINSANALTVTGLITGSGDLIKSGPGRLILGNSLNSYTGKTIVTGGIIQSGIAWNNQPGSIPGGMGNASTGSNIELNGGILSMDFNLDRSLGNGPGQIQITGGRSGINTMTNPRGTWTVGGNSSFEVVWGASGEGAATGFFNPSTFVMNDAAASPGYQSTLANPVDLNGANRTIEAASASHFGQLNGIIRNSNTSTAAGLIKTGVGELRLNAANTFNGTTTVSGGILNLNNALALQNSALDTTNSVTGGAAAGLRTTATTLTLGGLIGNKDFDDTAGSVFTTTTGGYGAVTALTLNVGTGNTHSYSGAIGNGAATTSLTKSGLGTQVLSGTNTYTGATNVNQGTLIVGVGGIGSTSSSSAVTVASGAILGGEGVIGGATTVNGSIAPGNSGIGPLTVQNNLTWNGGATPGSATDWRFELGASDISDYLYIDGDFTKGAGSSFRFDFLNSTDLGTFQLVTWTGSTNFLETDFSQINYDGAIAGSFSISDNSLYFTAIPEPSSALLSGILIGAGLLRRRRSA